MHTHTCEACGATFDARQARRRVCSIACRGVLLSGPGNPRYKGGLFQRSDGRWVVICRDGSSYLYYRGVAAAALGRELRDDEVVHHLNGDCSDDRPENLEVISQGEHIRLHLPEMHAIRWSANRARKAAA